MPKSFLHIIWMEKRRYEEVGVHVLLHPAYHLPETLVGVFCHHVVQRIQRTFKGFEPIDLT